MAFTVQLTDGIDTVDFTSVSFRLADGGLQISPPEETLTWSDPVATGGAALTGSRIGNRKITVNFQLAGTTRTIIRQNKNLISRMLNSARDHSLGLGSTRVTFRYGWDTVSEVDNFEVLVGTLSMPEDVMSVQKMLSQIGANFVIEGCQLELTVDPHAYGLSPSTSSLIELPLSNRNGTNVTGGIVISGVTDPYSLGAPFTGYGLQDSFVQINGANINGDAPAKVRVEVTPNGFVNGGYEMNRMRYGAQDAGLTSQKYFHWADPRMQIYLSGSTSTSGLGMRGPGESTSTMRYSLVDRWFSGRIWRITLTDDYAFGTYRVLMHSGYWWMKYPAYLPMQLVVETLEGDPLFYGPIIEVNKFATNMDMATVDLGAVPLPPLSPKMPAASAVCLSLYLLPHDQNKLRDYNFPIGHVQLLPTGRGYRQLKSQRALSGFGGQGVTLIDDNWSDFAALGDYSVPSNFLASLQAMYSPITLNPGKTHRIYFHPQGPALYEVYREYRVRVFYVPTYTGAV